MLNVDRLRELFGTSGPAWIYRWAKFRVASTRMYVRHWGIHMNPENPTTFAARPTPAESRWHCIDVELTGSVRAVSKMIHEFGLPLVAVRSKSNGTHVFAFFQLPVDNAPELMRGYAEKLGISDVSSVIFGCVLMPYGRGHTDVNCCAVIDGVDVTVEQFLDRAEMLSSGGGGSKVEPVLSTSE